MSDKKNKKDEAKASEGKESLSKIMKEAGAKELKEEPSLSPEARLFKLLKENGLTISVAESCTGGLVCSRLVSNPGVSEYFKEGFVTYSNKAKRRTLEVSKSTLKKQGAISGQVAKEMALGAAVNTDSDIAVAITGNAGPEAEEDKPVGLVYIGIYCQGKVKAFEYSLEGEREDIRQQAATEALMLCCETIEKLKKDDKH
ncbi:MAG TPA: CinA family protein [Candidatus Avilachnospira avistercoris]|nr:CinA family protein [Candidatus Avilachnospira avistercoris]